jgi:lipopolysaccharide biosynthesis regulator YciM
MDIFKSILIFALLLFAVRMLTRVDNKDVTIETKKCMKCLRRVKILHYKCPYCRNTDFHFDID